MSAIDELAAEFAKLPGIGRKTAARLTFHLLKQPRGSVGQFARAIEAVANRVSECGICGNFSESEPCPLCVDPRRDPALMCVVEEASDIEAIEQTGEFSGRYHVLGGHLSPLDGIGPDELRIEGLQQRLKNGTQVHEIIIATNPSMEGEVTATYLRGILAPTGVRISRIALGLPVGGDLGYADKVTIAQALSARREMIE